MAHFRFRLCHLLMWLYLKVSGDQVETLFLSHREAAITISESGIIRLAQFPAHEDKDRNLAITLMAMGIIEAAAHPTLQGTVSDGIYTAARNLGMSDLEATRMAGIGSAPPSDSTTNNSEEPA